MANDLGEDESVKGKKKRGRPSKMRSSSITLNEDYKEYMSKEDEDFKDKLNEELPGQEKYLGKRKRYFEQEERITLERNKRIKTGQDISQPIELCDTAHMISLNYNTPMMGSMIASRHNINKPDSVRASFFVGQTLIWAIAYCLRKQRIV